MAAKKRKSKGKSARKPGTAGSSVLPDRRAMEGTLRHLVAGLQGDVGRDTPLVRAQDLIYQAFDEVDADRRVQLDVVFAGLRRPLECRRGAPG